jgi:hypothetical protein
MSDPLEDLLRAAPLSDRQRAGLWDMYEASKNADDLAARLKSMELPDDIKAQMWDLKSQTTPTAPPEKTWSDKLGLNAPTDSMLTGFLRGSGGAAVDMVQGAASALGQKLEGKLVADHEAANSLTPSALPEKHLPASMLTETPQTAAGTIGSFAPTAAEMAVPMGAAAKGVKTAVGAIPRVARAGEKFQEVMGAAKNVPVDVTEVGDVALRISQLAERGGSMPLAVRKILNRMTDPAKAPMAYEEARDFASNISRLSANEFGRLTPAVAREVANLRVALNKANAVAAEAAGKGAEYKAAMREYARAMKLRDAVSAAVSGAKKALPAATAAGAAYWLTREVRSLLGAGTE